MVDVAKEVITLVQAKVRVDHPNLQLTDKLEDLGIESIDAVELIFDLEEKFDIQVPYNANNPRTEFNTVGDIVRAVEELVGGKA